MNRREFLQFVAAGAAIGGSVACSQGGKLEDEQAAGKSKMASTNVLAKNNSRQLKRVGVQLYTLRDLTKDDLPGTLQKLAEIGYKEVEFAGYFEHSPKDILKMLNDNGLTAPAAHASIQQLREDMDGLIAAAKTIGHKYLVCPWIGQEDRTAEGYKALSEVFNKAGEACKRVGLRFAYHNHDFEFDKVGGTIAYDLLLAETDPELVWMELDLYWIEKAGFDALEYFEKHPGRFPLCHVKDMDDEQKMVAVGKGKIDFAKLFAASEQAGLQYYFVEHDNPGDAIASVTSSYQYLSGLKF